MNDGKLAPSPLGNGLHALKLHFGFNQWANSRIFAQAALLSKEELMEPSQVAHGSAFKLLLHSVDTEWGWRIICQEGVQTPLLWEVEEIPDLDTLVRFWQGEVERMQAYLQSMSEADLNREVDYGKIFTQESRKATLLGLLSHILYHSSNHRSEMATYLTQCGHSPGDLEFLDYLQQASA